MLRIQLNWRHSAVRCKSIVFRCHTHAVGTTIRVVRSWVSLSCLDTGSVRQRGSTGSIVRYSAIGSRANAHCAQRCVHYIASSLARNRRNSNTRCTVHETRKHTITRGDNRSAASRAAKHEHDAAAHGRRSRHDAIGFYSKYTANVHPLQPPGRQCL